MVKTPQAGGSITEQEQEIAKVSAERTVIDTLAPQKTEANEALVKIPQAGGSIINSTRPLELSSTPSLALGTAAQETRAEEALVKTPRQGVTSPTRQRRSLSLPF